MITVPAGSGRFVNTWMPRAAFTSGSFKIPFSTIIFAPSMVSSAGWNMSFTWPSSSSSWAFKRRAAPSTQERADLSTATSFWLTMPPKAPTMAAPEITPTKAEFPPAILFCTFSILSAVRVETMIQPMEPRIMVQTAIVKAKVVISSTPSWTPADAVPIPAAMDSNITEPMKERRIQAMGPPTDTRSESIPLRITTDGPREVRAELFIARFT